MNLEADLILDISPPLPQKRSAVCRESLRAAIAVADDLLRRSRMNAAAVHGSKGGGKTARRLGLEHCSRSGCGAEGRPANEAIDCHGSIGFQVKWLQS